MKSTVLHMELCKTHIDKNLNYKLPTTRKVFTSFIQNTQDPHNIKGNLNQKYRETYSQQVESNNNKKKVHQSIVFSSACMCKALSLPLRIQSCDICSSTVQLPLNP